ncbi:MAG: thiol reductant ABC exporter subunit CydD [Brevundimonas sp.]
MSAVPIAPVSAAAWLKQVARPWRRLTLLAGLLCVADVVPAIGFAAGLALTIANLTVSPAAAAPWLALAVFSLVARGLIGQAAVIVGARLGRAIKTDVRGRLLSDLFGRGRRSGDRLTALVEGVGALDGYYSRFAPLRLAAGASPLLIIAAAAIASPVSAGVLLFTLFPFIVGMALAGTAAAGESRRQFQALERLSGLFIDRIRTLPAILAFDAVGRTTAQIAQASDELERRTARVMRIAFLSSGVLEFFSALSVALIAVYCGFNLLRLLPFPVPETLDLSRAFFVLALAPEVYAPLRRLAAAYHDRQAAEAAVPSMITPDPRPAPSPAPRPILRAPLGDLAPALHFRDVAIAYDGAAPVIDGFDLDVTPGQIVAVMGASGAGKSSLLHLLLGLAPLTRGEVEVGGVRFSLCGDIAGRVAWASQHPIVAPGTLAENIALADRTACPGRIALAARTAGLSGDLDRRIDERCGGLSGGERRRLGLARAILKRAPLLLLDEPTANLDPAAERAMLDVIRQAARGRTTLIATHSPAVAALADRVVRL